MNVTLQALALRGPGLEGWSGARAALAAETPWRPEEWPVPGTSLLKPNERRRLTPTLKLSLALAEEASADLDADDRARLPSVFASSLGDSDIIDAICTGLAEEGRPISPTRFHNSVHNAAAGYWAMATGNREASSSLAAGEWTAGAGLLEAMSQCLAYRQPVLYVLYDVLPPEPLRPLAGIHQGFGMAMRLAPEGHPGPSLGTLQSEMGTTLETRLPPPWESLRMASPAARHLALPYAVANGLASAVLPMDPRHNLEVRFRYDH